MQQEIDIKALRKANGWTQQDLGDRIGVVNETIHRWETRGIPKRGPAYRAIKSEWDATFGDGKNEGNDATGL